MRWSECENVNFTESRVVIGDDLGAISSALDGVFSQAQLKNLNDLKIVMAAEVKRRGGNVLSEFKYGQKSSFWRSLVSLDDVRWEGSGRVRLLSQTDLSRRD